MYSSVLSGMVVLQSLERFRHRSAPFLLARATRTLPAFLVVFAVAVAVQPTPTGLPLMPWISPDNPGRAIWSEGWPASWCAEIAAHLTMTHGLFPAGLLPHAWVSFLGAAWSLSTGVAVLCTDGRHRCRPPPRPRPRRPARLAISGAGGRRAALESPRVGGLELQPRVPAEQGAIFRAWHRQRWPGARGDHR